MINFKRNAAAGIIAIGLILNYAQPTSAIDLFANVDDYVHIRTAPNTQSEIVGYMFNNDMAQVIEQDLITGWVKVRSGNIIGWVNPNYFIQDNLFARGKVTAVIKNDYLNIYSYPTQDSISIENELKFGDIVSCVDSQNGWITIKLQDESYGFIKRTDCYISPMFDVAKSQIPLEILQPIEPITSVAIEYQQNNYIIEQEQNFENPIPENQIIIQQPVVEYQEPIIESSQYVDTVVYDNFEIVNEESSLANEEIVYYDGNIVTEDYYNYVNSDSYYYEDQPVSYQEPITYTSNSDIVSYADQYVGNPYVWGGNSLTDGIDCSHFVWQVLSNTGHYDGGYAVSDDWAYLGSGVDSLDNAVAGDVIVYPGHVAIYDGEGGIVEAKGQEWGITHDRSADSGEILAIRHFD